MRLSFHSLLSLCLCLSVSLLGVGCYSTDSSETAPVDYSTRDFTLDRLLDGSASYRMDVQAASYLSSHADIFSNDQGLSTEFNEGEVATLTFKLLPTGTLEAEFQITQDGELEHFVTADVIISEDGTLGLNTFVSNPNNLKSLGPGENYNLVGEIVKDSQGQVYLAFEGSVFHYPGDPNVVGNELFLRN